MQLRKYPVQYEEILVSCEGKKNRNFLTSILHQGIFEKIFERNFDGKKLEEKFLQKNRMLFIAHGLTLINAT